MEKNVRFEKVIKESIMNESDPEILRSIYVEYEGVIRRFAIRRLIFLNELDECEIYEIAKEDKDSENRRIAIKQIKNENTLYDIAISDENKENCIIAINSINDQKLLFSISKNDRLENEIRIAAIKRIFDEKMLIDIIENGADKINNVGVKEILADAKGKRRYMLSMLNYLLRKETAIVQLKNQDYLKKFAIRKFEFVSSRILAIENIKDENILKELERTIKDPILLVIIRNKLGTSKCCK